MYRNTNINDLINRFEVTNDNDFDMTENLKYSARQNARKFKMQSGDESFANDENRSLMKYDSDRVFLNTSNIFIQKTTTASGAKEFIKQLLHKISALLEMISKFPFPRMSVMSFGLTSLLSVFLAPRAFTDRVIYPGFKILFTIIYPAYRSFKAVRNKNLKEYLKWIVYWIVYAFFTCLELVTDALFNWFPFYYEIKVIFLIWLLGPSSRGAMKVYKGIIHPMLISREREIDDVIQLAQDFGYMQVFRLSSKSVNYANKIIMQDTNTDTDSIMLSNQLMKNISLSNISDAGNIDSDELFRMRRFSLDKVPVVNYPYEQHRKPSFDYRYDDMSSGYASPTQPIHFRKAQSGAYIENVISCEDLSRKNSIGESIPRKSSITQLSDDEIINAYHNLLKQQQQPLSEKIIKNDVREETYDENYREFLRWMEMKRGDESKKNILLPESKPQAIPLNDNRKEKVNTNDVNDDAISVVADVNPIDAVEKETFSIPPAESDRHKFFELESEDEFKDAISDEGDYLNVPLVIHEANDDCRVRVNEGEMKTEVNEDIDEANAIIPTIIEEKSSHIEAISSKANEPKIESSVLNATLTLSNDPLKITADLSTSNMSLVSNDESSNKKKPARHSKGRAPLPPTLPQQIQATSSIQQPTTSTSNEVE